MTKLDVINAKITDKKTLGRWLATWRFKKQKIVFTNGCFDILHKGHLEYLAKAADLGDVLIIGLNTDASTHRLKGNGRPVNDEQARALLLASLHFVDAVILFDEETPYELISFIKPDILVKGADYRKDQIVGYDIVTSNGGKVITIDLLPEYSTTHIIERIKNINTSK